MTGSPLKVAVWSTGGVGSIAIAAIRERPDLELVGVWVHSPEKVGKDVGELAGGAPLGLAATNDADALIALRPDCIVYGASGPERDAGAVSDYVRFLNAGINVVTTTSTGLVYPPAYNEEWRGAMEAAARAGGASLYASGIFPGFVTDQLALIMATQSRSIAKLTVWERALNDHYPVASAMMDGMGFGRPLDFTPALARPGAIAMSWGAPIHYLASALGVKLDSVTGTLDRQVSERAIDVAFGRIEPGTCGAVRTRAIGMAGGKEAIVVEHLIRMARDVAPDWPNSEYDATYGVTIEGDPDIECAMHVGDAVGHGAGHAAMTSTTMRVLNAVPHVVAARPGLLSSLDLPMTFPAGAFHP